MYYTVFLNFPIKPVQNTWHLPLDIANLSLMKLPRISTMKHLRPSRAPALYKYNSTYKEINLIHIDFTLDVTDILG